MTALFIRLVKTPKKNQNNNFKFVLFTEIFRNAKKNVDVSHII